MYGRSRQQVPLGASGYYDEPPDTVPYNNDRLDDAVSVDYSLALGGTKSPRTKYAGSGIYSSKILRSSEKRQSDENYHYSGEYESKIKSSRPQHSNTPLNTSTPRILNSFEYGDRLRESTTDGNNFQVNAKASGFPIGLGRTVHTNFYNGKPSNHQPPLPEEDIPLEVIESPRSAQWPETARSYPVGFEAANIVDGYPYIGPQGESTDQATIDVRKKRRVSQRQQNEPKTYNYMTQAETPGWATRLLTKESSLIGKFKDVKSAISRWTLRQKSRLPLYGRTQGPTGFEMFNNASDSTENLDSMKITKRQRKTNNMAWCLGGLSLIFLFVFPIILIMVIFTDRSDYVQVTTTIQFNGDIDTDFNANVNRIKYSICYEVDKAFENTIYSFYSCNVTNFRTGSIHAEVLLLFEASHIPNENTIINGINAHFKNFILLNHYSYVQDSVKHVQFGFTKRRLIGTEQQYIKGQTTIDANGQQITGTSTTSVPTVTLEATTTSKNVMEVSTIVEQTTPEITQSSETTMESTSNSLPPTAKTIAQTTSPTTTKTSTQSSPTSSEISTQSSPTSAEISTQSSQTSAEIQTQRLTTTAETSTQSSTLTKDVASNGLSITEEIITATSTTTTTQSLSSTENSTTQSLPSTEDSTSQTPQATDKLASQSLSSTDSNTLSYLSSLEVSTIS